MIYLFRGTDTDKVRAKAFAWIAAARQKEPNLAYARLAREELTAGTLAHAAQSGGLFVKRLLVLLDDPYGNARAKDEDDAVAESASVLDDALEMLEQSDNVIVVLAPKLPTAKAKKLAANAAKEYVVDLPAVRVAARGFNTALVNALAAKKRDALWLEVERALRAGDAPEMVHGLLHWKARDLMQKGSRAWPPAEARALSLALIALLVESRRKGLDLAESLERFALSI